MELDLDLDTPDLPTYYMGFCDVCRSAKTFTSQKERDGWEKFHPHGENS
jgi:hypothetical protein